MRFAPTPPGHFQAWVPWRLVVQITHHARASRPPAGARKEARRRRRTNENDTTAQRAQRARPWALTESPRTAWTPRTPRVARPYARAMPRSSPRLRRRREAELPRFAARIEERGEKGDTTRGEKRGDSPAPPRPCSAAAARAARPHDHYAPASASRGRRLSRCALAWARSARSGEQREDATTRQSGGPAAGETDDND